VADALVSGADAGVAADIDEREVIASRRGHTDGSCDRLWSDRGTVLHVAVAAHGRLSASPAAMAVTAIARDPRVLDRRGRVLRRRAEHRVSWDAVDRALGRRSISASHRAM